MSDAMFTITVFSVMGLESGQVESSEISSKGSKTTSWLWDTYQKQPPYLCVLACLDFPMSDHEDNINKIVSWISAFLKALQWPEMSWQLHEDRTYPLAAMRITDVPSCSGTPVAILSNKLVLLTSWHVFAGFGFWTVKNKFLKTMFSLYCRGNSELI